MWTPHDNSRLRLTLRYIGCIRFIPSDSFSISNHSVSSGEEPEEQPEDIHYNPSTNSKCAVTIQTMHYSSLPIHGARLFDKLTKSIIEMTFCNVQKFKSKLDEFIRKIPDEPQIPGYTNCRRANTNSLIDMVEDVVKAVGTLVTLM